MRPKLSVTIAAAAALLVALAGATPAQKKPRQTAGGVKGRVRVESGHSPAGISVTARLGEREAAETTTGRGGEFELKNLAAGTYELTFRKPGLSTGRMSVEVRAGKVRSLSDKLYMPVDEGALAFVRGTVFDQEGRILPGAEVELARLMPDGSAKRLDRRVGSELGSFSFRLPPEPARYRVTARAGGRQTATQEVEIDGAGVFRVALTLAPGER